MEMDWENTHRVSNAGDHNKHFSDKVAIRRGVDVRMAGD